MGHIDVYGVDNDQRLTGLHETQSIHQFSYGVSDRGASIRIPIATAEAGFKGRLEDRRPASNACPYQVCDVIIKTTDIVVERYRKNGQLQMSISKDPILGHKNMHK